MEQKEQKIRELEQEEIGQASGGTFDDNVYKDDEYEDVGIRLVTHFFARDEFWWNGVNIGHDNANAVVLFCRQNGGRQPASVEEAVAFKRQLLYERRKNTPDIRKAIR